MVWLFLGEPIVHKTSFRPFVWLWVKTLPPPPLPPRIPFNMDQTRGGVSQEKGTPPKTPVPNILKPHWICTMGTPNHPLPL